MNEKMVAVGFDYEIPHTCQYPVTSRGTPEPEMDCGEPAPYRGNWVDDDLEETSEMWLCREHLERILRCEKKYL